MSAETALSPRAPDDRAVSTPELRAATPAPAVSPNEAGFARLAGRPLFWAALVSLIAALAVVRSVLRPPAAPPELRLPLPAFQLTNERGSPFGSADLAGKVWVADFFFTSCPTVCPRLTERMAEIQRRTRHLGDAFHLVSITVDPENDTPEKLRAFAGPYQPDPRRWTFLTGSLDVVETTVVKGFKMVMGKEEVERGLFSIFHGERFVLVDKTGNIRGYYEANDEGIATMLRDAEVLANMP